MNEKKKTELSSWMEEKLKLKPEEAKTLRDLEELMGISIPKLENRIIDMSKKNPIWNFGVKIFNEHIIEITLGGRKLTELPESIGNLTSLKKLLLIGSPITKLPDSIGNLKSLNFLYLRSNCLKKLPESIGHLKSLLELHIYNILVGKGKKRKLQGNNQLTTLPDSIGELTSLINLGLSGNKLSNLPDSIGELTSLKGLFLDYNQLRTLPDSIGNLSSLKSISVQHNRLEKIPETIGNLKSLQTLYLNNNLLTSLPESIKNLTSLKTLLLSSNKMEKIPETISNLTSLQIFEVDDNLIKNIPKSVSELKTLHLMGGSCKKLKQESSIRGNVMNEFKKNVIPAHANGTYLAKLNEEELRAREIEKKRRREELHLVEKVLKEKQVKFLVSVGELEDIKKYALISHQTQSEFIRTAIRDKIQLVDAQDQDLKKPRKIQEDMLRLDELKKIRKVLDRIERKEKAD